MQDWLFLQFREMTLLGPLFFCVATVLDISEVHILYINYKMAIDWS